MRRVHGDGAARGQAKQELGLQTYGIEETVRVAADSRSRSDAA